MCPEKGIYKSDRGCHFKFKQVVIQTKLPKVCQTPQYTDFYKHLFYTIKFQHVEK